MAFHHDLNHLLRSWRRQFATQFTTWVVLSATLSIVVFMTSLSINLNRILTLWGERVQIAVYLEDGISKNSLEKLKAEIRAWPEVGGIEYVPKEKAAKEFRDQMASYAPDLLDDSEFSTPFPATLQVQLSPKVQSEARVQELEKIALEIGKKDGVEDVSWGQSWVKNYAGFVSVLQSAGLAIGVVLLCGSLFVIGNAIRASISTRREEISILELVGATPGMIRRPYIIEGAILGGMAAIIALCLNAALFSWELSMMRKSFAFARMAGDLEFMSVSVMCLVFGVAVAFGALGAWLTIKSINDGWSAAKAGKAAGV